jgi:hypothetical protein
LAVVLLVLRVKGLEPRDRRPGLWLRGDLVTSPVADWSFTDKFPTIEVQTRTWYKIPHSVIITCISNNGRLYLISLYRGGVQYPNGRVWHRDVARDPHVRLKIGSNLYDGIVSYVVTDPSEMAAVLEAKLKKYPPYGRYTNPNRKPSADSRDVLLRFMSD